MQAVLFWADGGVCTEVWEVQCFLIGEKIKEFKREQRDMEIRALIRWAKESQAVPAAAPAYSPSGSGYQRQDVPAQFDLSDFTEIDPSNLPF